MVADVSEIDQKTQGLQDIERFRVWVLGFGVEEVSGLKPHLG